MTQLWQYIVDHIVNVLAFGILPVVTTVIVLLIRSINQLRENELEHLREDVAAGFSEVKLQITDLRNMFFKYLMNRK